MELEGTWNLDKVRYTYRTKNGDTWQTDVDETYADASGQITFVYPDSFDFEWNYTFTFDSTTVTREFTGDYTNAVQEFIRIKSNGENVQFDGQAITDFFLMELNEESLKLNRLLTIPEIDEKKWQLEFSKQWKKAGPRIRVTAFSTYYLFFNLLDVKFSIPC